MKTFFLTLIFFCMISSICFAQQCYWTKVGDMPEIRFVHTINELNGKIYVVGGVNAEGSALPTTALVNDRSSGEWDTIPLYNNIVRFCHTSCVVGGKLYVIGGNDGNKTIATMDMFDPNIGWVPKDSMPTDRALLACATIDSKIYVMGGLRSVGGGYDYGGIKTMEVYDVVTETWSQLPDMPTKRWGHSAVAYDGKIYVVGGVTFFPSTRYKTVEVYDPQDSTWTTQSGLMPTARYCITSCLLNDKLYAIGGWYDSSDGPIYNKVEFYIPELDTWYTETPMPVARAALASIVLDGKIYIYGGARTTHPNIGTSAIYELSYDDIFAQQPYTDKTYAKENIDSVLFTTRFSNPYGHQFTPYLIHANSDSTQLDSLNLLDDGLHGDSLTNDGLYGVYLPPRQNEDIFILGVSTIDNQTNKYYNTPNRCRFTTVGPVELDSISITQLSALFYKVNPFLKNKSTAVTITDASVSLLCNDPWIISIQPDLLELPDIPPGGVVSHSTGFTVRIDTSLFQDCFNFEVNVIKDEWLYWVDSMRYPPIALISINPTELNFGEVAIDSSVAKTFTITNLGDEVLIVSDITSSNPVFTINITSATIPRHSNQEVEVTFTPAEVLSYNGKIEITHNAAGSPDSVVVTGDGVTGVEEELQPLTFSIEQNYPNPFNPITTIKYSIPEVSKVMLKLFNLLGEEVAVLVNEEKVAGYYTKEFNASALPSGVYFYQLKAGDFVETKKMILLK